MLARKNSFYELGSPPFLLLTRTHEVLVRYLLTQTHEVLVRYVISCAPRVQVIAHFCEQRLEQQPVSKRNQSNSFATSVKRILPSEAGNFNWLQFVTVSFPSFIRRFFNTFQYVRPSALSVNTLTISTTEKKYFSFSSSHTTRTFAFSKSCMCIS